MRRHDWECSLVAYARAQLGRPFRWSETDCFSVAHGAMGAVYEANPIEDVPPYSDRESAQAVLQGFGDVAATLGAMGGAPLPASLAQQGDLLTLPGDDGHGLARFAVMVDGRGHVLTSSPECGVELINSEALPEGTLAWRWSS